MNLLKSFDTTKEDMEKFNRVVDDADTQLTSIKTNVANFGKLGKRLGLPPTFIESLCPGIISVLSLNPTIMKNFIKKFADDFGCTDDRLQENIGSFVINDSSYVRRLGKAFGLPKGMLATAVKLFGVSHPEQSIEEISLFFDYTELGEK